MDQKSGQDDLKLLEMAIQAAIDVAQATGHHDIALELGAVLMDLVSEGGTPRKH